MRTTLNISDEVIKELYRFSNEKSKAKAVSIAIKDYIRRKKIDHLLSLSGKISIDYDWAKEEEKEIVLEEKEENKRKRPTSLWIPVYGSNTLRECPK